MTVKQERMNERIQAILSELLLLEVKDPRLSGVTITEVQLDRELQFARVYVNALGEEGRKDEVMAGLESAKGFLRREVGARVRLRRTPELRFEWDKTLAYSDRVHALLNALDIPPAEEEEAEDADTDIDDDLDA
jgi:ribosome-binding factor A